MHISEGVLSGPVLLAGAGLTIVGTAVGLKRIDYDRVMPVAILSACFFIASLIHVPVGVTSVHLLLNGLIGVVLGWAAFPSILVALALQAVLFQFGGLSTLGVNCFDMAAPAVICFYVFRPMLTSSRTTHRFAAAFACGFISVFLSAGLTACALGLSGEGFRQAAWLLFTAHIPIMIAEGFITGFAYSFLARVKPEVLSC